MNAYIRTCNKKLPELVGSRVQLHILGDEITIEVGQQCLFNVPIRLNPDGAIGDKNKNVCQNTALDVCDESFATLSGAEPMDVIRAEVVEKSPGILTGHLNLCAIADIEQNGLALGGLIFTFRVAEMESRRIAEPVRLRRRGLVVQWNSTS